LYFGTVTLGRVVKEMEGNEHLSNKYVHRVVLCAINMSPHVTLIKKTTQCKQN
jgi:hypothetical protein